jgi:two-component system, NarL family, nitrate/nitrite response regulator NarL
MAHNPDRIRIVIVDDHTLLREALGDVLRVEPDIAVVGQAGDAGEAVAVVRRTQPDIVLLDMEIPGGQPAEVTRRLAEASPHSRMIVLTMYDSPALVRDMLDLGVHGYLHKSVSRLDLAEAIRGVHHGERIVLSVSPEVKDADPGVLSTREREVIALVAEALSNRQIAARLHITEGTVKRHLRNIFDKLGAVSRIDAVNKAELLDP